LNRSRIAAVVCVPLTSNLVWADAPWNTLVTAKAAGLPKDSVANASQIITLDRTLIGGTPGQHDSSGIWVGWRQSGPRIIK
jgi:mRNA interferase MazF